jgi:hypothetical protein
MPPLFQLCHHCIELDEEQINFNGFIYNIVYHNLNKNKVEEVKIKIPEKFSDGSDTLEGCQQISVAAVSQKLLP